jgi:TldD protein
MKDLLNRALDRMSAQGAQFCDARQEEVHKLSIKVSDAEIREVTDDRMAGVCFRCRVGGAWGYASTVRMDRESMLSTCERAVRVAKSGRVQGAPLVKQGYQRQKVDAGVRKHPDQVGLEEKLEAMRRLERSQRVDDRIVNSNADYREGVKKVILLNSLGADLEWEEVRTRFMTLSVASEAGRTEFYYDIQSGSSGYELVDGRDMEEMGRHSGEEAIKTLGAGKPPSGLMTCITDPGVTGTLAHEVIGHASEADEVVKRRSFLTGMIGKRVATDLITMVDDGTVPGAYGSIPFDDEGTPSSRSVIIKNGIYRGYLHSLETASEMDVWPTGNGRAEDFTRRIWVRMTNTFFEPGDWTLEEMVEDVQQGVLTDKAISGMEDPVGGGFEAQALRGYLIEKGEIRGMVRSFALTGNALEILRTTDAVSRELVLEGGTCGKGTEDYVPVTTGGAYCRSKIILGGD